jgi:hypothetical protein
MFSLFHRKLEDLWGKATRKVATKMLSLRLHLALLNTFFIFRVLHIQTLSKPYQALSLHPRSHARQSPRRAQSSSA